VRRRLFVEDSRKNGTYLRATWHPEGDQFVLSTWDDEVCTGAVRVSTASAASLISLLADGLADAATHPITVDAPGRASATGRFDRLRAWVRARIHRVAPAPVPAPLHTVDELHHRRSA
jgi:hypothetical protein